MKLRSLSLLILTALIATAAQADDAEKMMSVCGVQGVCANEIVNSIATPVTVSTSGAITAGTTLTATLGNITATNGNLAFGTAGNGVLSDIGTLAALGTNQATAAAITRTVTRVTAADGTVGVSLPALSTAMIGKQYVVINSDVTNALKVYAAGAETITGQAGTTAISVAAKLMLRCWAYDATNWYCEKGVLPY